MASVPARARVVSVNLSPTLGGAEVYTAFFARALASAGWSTRTRVAAGAAFWSALDFGRTPVDVGATTDCFGPTTDHLGRTGIELGGIRGDFGETTANRAPPAAAPPGAADIVVVHAPVARQWLKAWKKTGATLVGVAHQTLYDRRRPAYYEEADYLLPVSHHVARSLAAHGFANVHAEPLHGVAELRGEASVPRPGRLFDSDQRKLRDRVIERFGGALAREPEPGAGRAGFTLGIVSRIAPLKQFPDLFVPLLPVLLRQPTIGLDIFGAAVGYKPLAELRRSLAPLGARVRFWGDQREVAAAYRSIDALLLGRPEREALGLNALEAALAGTPTLAIDAPPFDETVAQGLTGFRFVDPARDQGRDFERVLCALARREIAPDWARAAAHLEHFGAAAFQARVDRAMHAVVQIRGAARG